VVWSGQVRREAVGRVARQRIALRLLLLVVTAIGIAGMHTLGHPGDAGTGGSVHTAAMPLGEESMAEAVGAAMTVVISGDMHGTGMRMDPFNVCVAILVGGLLALLVALLIRDRRRRMPDSDAPTALALAGRGPPKPSRLGLRLADLSVQRT
jgi:hypothetical protein